MIKSLAIATALRNYSVIFSGRLPGEPPPTLLDYFRVTICLYRRVARYSSTASMAMWHGDVPRKQNLVDYAFVYLRHG